MTNAEFGRVMDWGSGNAQAILRKQTLSPAELLEAGITEEICELWRRFYVDALEENSNNPSARGRAELMEYARDLLRKVAK